MNTYCLYCKSGSEEKVVRSLEKSIRERLHEEAEILYPIRVMNQKRRGIWNKVNQPLFPGYVFLYLSDDIPFPLFLIHEERNAYKVLRNLDASLALKGGDEEYAMWVYRHHGIIRPSKVKFENGRLVKVIDGPLLDMSGKIVKVDRHHKRVNVSFMFGGKEQVINMSIEDLSDGAQNTPN